MAREVAGYVLEQHAFADGVSTIWHARSSADTSQRATVRLFDIPEGGDFAGPLFAFRQDTEAATGLTHDHVLTTLDVGWRGRDHTYVISPHTEAVPLRDQFRADPLGVDQALTLLSPVADALDAAAEMGLPHGAIHPLSIWVEPPQTDDGAPRALLSGFGLHHILRVLAVRQREGGVMDDFLYIAPELLRGGRPTNRSDQYALAGALLHAVTGHPPYQRDGLAALFGAHLFGPAGGDASPHLQEGGGEAFAQIMRRALAKNPDNRFDSCQHLVAAVHQLWYGAAGDDAGPEQDPRDAAVPVPEPAAVEPTTASEPTASEPAAAPAAAAVSETPVPDMVHPAPVQPRRRERRRTRVAMFAAVGVIVGVVAVLVVMARVSPPPTDAPPPADTRALAAATELPASPSPQAAQPPGMRWHQTLPAPASDLYVTSVGVVAVTPTQVVVVDPNTGGVLDHLDAAQPTTVTDEGGLITTSAGGLQVHDIQDGSLQWQSEISGVRPPAVADGTLYGISDDAVPQLVAADAESGQRLWQFPGEEPAFPADTAIAPGDDFVYLADSATVYGILPEGASVGADTAVINADERAPEPLCVWRLEVDDELWLSSLRAVADGVVVAERAGNVCMRRQSDGEPVWCLRVRGADGVEPAVLTTDTDVFVVTPSAVTAIDARTGQERWTRPGEWSDAVLGEGRLLVIAADGSVASLSTEDGQVQTVQVTASATVGGSAPATADAPATASAPATADAPATASASEPATASPSAIAVDGDMLYAALDDGQLVSVDMTELIRS